VLAIFYHALGHASIDLRQLPIYGQEEDAADVASVILMHALYDEEAVQAMVISTADAFLAEAEKGAGEIAFYDPDTKAITMCTELEDHLRQIYQSGVE
jgi:hypothetical protein